MSRRKLFMYLNVAAHRLLDCRIVLYAAQQDTTGQS